MTINYWTIEVIHEFEEDSREEDLLYYGTDIKEVYKKLYDYLDSKTAAYGIIGESIVTGECDYYYSWLNKDYLHVTCVEDEDGSDETWDD